MSLALRRTLRAIRGGPIARPLFDTRNAKCVTRNPKCVTRNAKCVSRNPKCVIRTAEDVIHTSPVATGRR